jgi:FkbM family methyltransferase
LRKNLQRNGCTNVTVVEEALGDETKLAKLYQRDDNRGALSTADIFGVGETNAISIRMRRADEVFAEFGRSPRVAKIDVEGQEPLVIAGMGSHLPDVLLFEFVPAQLRAARHEPLQFLNELEGMGYSLSLVDAATGERRDMPATQLLHTGEAAINPSNVLALRTKRLG